MSDSTDDAHPELGSDCFADHQSVVFLTDRPNGVSLCIVPVERDSAMRRLAGTAIGNNLSR
jgi:hypothetical protein